MDIQDMLRGMGDRLSASASVKNVYGEPVVVGGRTVIPAARVRYGFGGGGGNRQNEAGGGGGGGVWAQPCGALEITPEGTRFIRFENRRAAGAALALGFLLGAMVAGLTARRRVEIVKRPG
jgi:uncharacterized spore protein YtfJ